MNRPHALVASLTVLIGVPATGALALPGALAVPTDSFIKQHVDTVPQLSQQVTFDPVVRRRLARHFHTSGPAVARYIQKNLVLEAAHVRKNLQGLVHHAGRARVYHQLPFGLRHSGLCHAGHERAGSEAGLRKSDGGGFTVPA